MPRVRVLPDAVTLECAKGENLLRVLRENGFTISSPCNGNGTCKKCKVILLPEEIEKPACLIQVEEDLEIRIPSGNKEGAVLTAGYRPENIKIDGRPGFGIAVDIGTTTVAAALIEFGTGKELASTAGYNAQGTYGADVLTRISYEYEEGEVGIKTLQTAIVGQLSLMTDRLCEQADVAREEIEEYVIGANCTMMHLLLGVDARSIGKAPYRPAFTEAQRIPSASIGLIAGRNTMLYCLPQVSAYIGADITAGAYVCSLDKKKNHTLFIDIGTNGEIVLSDRGRLLCCSCAAGPALEGMNISCGMQAAEGAVEEVEITESGVKLQVIGDTLPTGICGSGILGILKELVRTGLIGKNGTFMKPEKLAEDDYRRNLLQVVDGKREFLIHKEQKLLLTQNDVRQVQMAKGAILSGIRALLAKAELRPEELDEVLIAGQFGAHLSAESLTGSQILPEEVKDKIRYVGNSSRTGAYLALLSEQVKEEISELAKHMEYMELAETENYERLFAESMMFIKK